MALAIDLGQANELHPKNKQDVGRRLALIALNKTYGMQDVKYSGPVYDKSTVDGGKIKITFTEGSGLNFKTTPATGFEIAGEDQVFHPATAILDGDTVVVSSPEVKNPVAVRYAWANAPQASLYNSAGLPAVPFRTDTWPRKAQAPVPLGTK